MRATHSLRIRRAYAVAMDAETDGSRSVHLDAVERLDLGEPARWLSLRRALGVTAFGINAYEATSAGDELIERHDDRSPGSGQHEELYVVMRGRATFTLDGAEHDAPAGTLLRVSPGVERSAIAAESETLVVIVGGAPRAAMPPSPFEYWYAALPAVRAGDPQAAVAVASEGLEFHPDHPQLRYQLACFSALAGDRDAALDHLAVAVRGRPEVLEWAADDEDLDSIRDDPRFP